MNGIDYQLIAWILVLICLKIKSTYTSEGQVTLREIGWTLDNLSFRVDSLGGNLVNF